MEHFETTRIRKDGSLIEVSLSIFPVLDDSGQLIAVSSIIRDITERKRAHDAVQRLAAIVESSSDAIYSTALDGTITSWNRGVERLLGYKGKEIIGQHFALLSPPHLLEGTRATHEELISGQTVEAFESEAARKDGISSTSR